MIVEPDHYELADVLASLHVDNIGADSWQQILEGLHPKQRAFVEDPSPRKIALKGRRAGGSWGIVAWLLQDWQEWSGQLSLFIAQSQDHAKRIIWSTLHRMDDRYGLGIVFNSGELSATLPNGYKILLTGARDKTQVERLRGFASGLRRCVIDEAGTFQGHDAQFRYLINDVLIKQFMDTIHLGGGQLALVGSPGLDPLGYYFECSTGFDHKGKPRPKWSTHHWTALDNPHIDAAAGLLEDLENGDHILDGSTPEEIVTELIRLRDIPASNDNEDWTALKARLSAAFRREVLALWVRDNESRVYTATDRNYLPDGYELDPHRAYRIIVAADIGWNDGNGFCVAAKCLESPEIILLEAYRVDELGTEGIAKELKRLASFWRSGEIYVDTGGVGDMRLEDLANFGCYARRAMKGGRKKPRIEYVRSLLENGNLKIRRENCVDLLTEWITLSWSPDRQLHREGVPDDCLVAGTLVLTTSGPRPIETIRRGDEVMTRKGPRLVEWAGMSRLSSEVLTVTFSNGSTLTGTRGHPVWVQGVGWVALDTLVYGDECYPSPSTAFNSISTSRPAIGAPGQVPGLTAPMTFIERFGRPVTGQYQPATTSTTRTATRATTTSPIWSASLHLPTVVSMVCPRVSSEGWSWLERPPAHGMEALRAGSGTERTPYGLGRMPPRSPSGALGAAMSLRPDGSRRPASAPRLALPARDGTEVWTTNNVDARTVAPSLQSTSIARHGVARVHVVHVGAGGSERSVWNLRVQGEPEFYANGVLTHNCSDGMLYAVYPLSQLFIPPEERPKPGTPEYRKAEDDREREASIKAGKRIKRQLRRRGG